MPVSKNELVENHKRYLERIELYRKHRYDVDLERLFVIEKALPVSGNLLEIGTGKGYFSLALARAGFSFTTCDLSATEQWYAGLNLAYYGLAGYVRFDIADLECLPYTNSSYDAVFAVNLLHHLPSLEPACGEMVRVLSSSGKIVLSDFNEKGLEVVDRIHALDGKKHDVSGVTISEAKTLFEQYGLNIELHHGKHQDVLVVYGKGKK
jgi:ubiquinone/menaquinone biosynthesis C-methylase UbiE